MGDSSTRSSFLFSRIVCAAISLLLPSCHLSWHELNPLQRGELITEMLDEARRDDVRGVEKYLARGVDAEYCPSAGPPPLLSFAVSSGALRVTEHLLAKHPRLLRSRCQPTALLVAQRALLELEERVSATRRQEIFDLFFKYPLPPGFLEVRDYSGFTALQLAVKERALAMVRQLLDAGANLHAESNWFDNTLEMAAKNDDHAMLGELLRRNADRPPAKTSATTTRPAPDWICDELRAPHGDHTWVVTARGNFTLEVRQKEDGKVIDTIPLPFEMTRETGRCVLTRDGGWLFVMSGDSKSLIWNLTTRHRAPPFSSRSRGSVVTSDRSRIVRFVGNTLVVYDGNNGAILSEWRTEDPSEESFSNECVEFSRDGSELRLYVVSLSEGGQLRFHPATIFLNQRGVQSAIADWSKRQECEPTQ